MTSTTWTRPIMCGPRVCPWLVTLGFTSLVSLDVLHWLGESDCHFGDTQAQYANNLLVVLVHDFAVISRH